jgi:hypothetical protein
MWPAQERDWLLSASVATFFIPMMLATVGSKRLYRSALI